MASRKDHEEKSLDEELQELKQEFERDGVRHEGVLDYRIKLMRRTRSDVFSGGDALFKVHSCC